jgi:hypothetical protein
MPDFTFATYRDLPNLDPDDRLAADALARRGVKVDAAVWNDDSVEWSRAGIVIVRSTWDYHLDPEGFLRWAARISSVTALWNPLEVIRWNVHKGYLRSLAERGVPVVETAWIAKGGTVDIEGTLRERGWSKAVIKPGIGLATRGVIFVDQSPEGLRRGQEHAIALAREHDVMVQPFMESVKGYGERALVFIGREFSHTVTKTAFQPLMPTGEAGETRAIDDPKEIAVACKAVVAVDGELLFARVDLVRDADDEPLVIELEVVEPSLFLGFHPPSVERFADALAALL